LVRLTFLMRSRLSLASCLALGLFLAGPVAEPRLFASAAIAATISNVVVEGSQRVEDDTVAAYLQLGPGDSFDAVRIDESIKALFDSGLFSDVAISQRGSTLVVRITENPLINVVNFEGNSEIDDDTLSKEVEVRERMIFTRARVQSDTRRILALYQRQGYYNVRVAPKLIRLQDNRVNLVFEVTEGDETVVRTINFEGNANFDDGDLRGVIATKEYAWWRFFGKQSTYDGDRIEYDKELLRRHYLKNGFADVQILSADPRLSQDGESFTIEFRIQEGPRYSVADVAVNVGDANLDADGLTRVVKTGVGDTYDASKVDKTVENLTLEASKQGFVFAKVEPKVDRETAANQVRLTYDITEGPRTYVERIDIIGNSRTRDEVIRRELRLFEGDAFNRVLVERARRRLTALDFFEKIDFSEREGSAPDKVVLVVEVAEKSTGSISFSAGYSSTETVVGSVELMERNLLGKGQQMKLNTQLSFRRQQLDFSFTEPYFLGMPISAGFDAFATRTDNRKISSYRSEQIGGALRTGFKLDEFSSVSFKYYLARRSVDDITISSAAPAIINQEGTNWKSAVSGTYTWDDLDNPARPSSGLRAQIEGEVAGLGGDDQYAALEGRLWYFAPLFDEKVVLKFEANAGHIMPFDSDEGVPLQDRFFKGADTFRGFAKSGVGPRQRGNDGELDSIGADTYAIGTVEAIFPLGLPESFGLEGVLFSDFGTVFGSNEDSVAFGTGNCVGNGTNTKDCEVFDTTAFRASIGAGVIWQSPFGPLRLEAAYPIVKADYDDTEWFRFSVGTRF
jgi:outer membrane protein insertion porin family